MNYGDLRDSVLRMLGNPLGDGIEPLLIVDAIAAAHDAILPWCPKVLSTTIEGDGTKTAFDLPGDFYDVQAVIDATTSEVLGKGVLSPGAYYGLKAAGTNTWLLLPSNQITFAKPLATSYIYQIIYYATWAKPSGVNIDDVILEPPAHLATAMSLYACSYLLYPDVVNAASYGTFKTRVDSGNPEHNPTQKAVTFFLNLFNQEMSRHPKVIRATV